MQNNMTQKLIAMDRYALVVHELSKFFLLFLPAQKAMFLSCLVLFMRHRRE